MALRNQFGIGQDRCVPFRAGANILNILSVGVVLACGWVGRAENVVERPHGERWTSGKIEFGERLRLAECPPRQADDTAIGIAQRTAGQRCAVGPIDTSARLDADLGQTTKIDRDAAPVEGIDGLSAAQQHGEAGVAWCGCECGDRCFTQLDRRNERPAERQDFALADLYLFGCKYRRPCVAHTCKDIVDDPAGVGLELERGKARGADEIERDDRPRPIRAPAEVQVGRDQREVAAACETLRTDGVRRDPNLGTVDVGRQGADTGRAFRREEGRQIDADLEPAWGQRIWNELEIIRLVDQCHAAAARRQHRRAIGAHRTASGDVEQRPGFDEDAAAGVNHLSVGCQARSEQHARRDGETDTAAIAIGRAEIGTVGDQQVVGESPTRRQRARYRDVESDAGRARAKLRQIVVGTKLRTTGNLISPRIDRP